MRQKDVLSAAFLLLVSQTQTPFDAARKGDASAILSYLDLGGDSNAREPKKTVPSLEKNDPGGKPYLGDTLLILAVEANSKPLVELLLKRGANPNRVGEYGYTPLITSASRSNVELTRILLRAGANPNLRNDFGDPALVLAASYGKVEIVDMLLRRGAILKGDAGYHALAMALNDSDPKIAALLLKRGVDPNFHPKGRRTPLAIAASNDLGAYVKLLKRYGARGDAAKLSARAKVESKKVWSEVEKKVAEREKRTHAIPGEKMTSEDALVIEAAMRAFLTEYTARNRERKVVTLRLSSSTVSIGEWDDSQMTSDVGEERAGQIALDLRRSLYDRNRGLTTLAGFRSGEGIELVDPKALSHAETRLQFDRPYATVMLPGYSSDRRRSLARFYFGPTAHSAKGTVLLERQGAIWHALWCKLAYYA